MVHSLCKLTFIRKLDETQMQTTESKARIPIVYRVTPVAALMAVKCVYWMRNGCDGCGVNGNARDKVRMVGGGGRKQLFVVVVVLLFLVPGFDF